MLCHFRVQEDHPIMSFTVSRNGRLALLNVATQVSILLLSHIMNHSILLNLSLSLFKNVCLIKCVCRECTYGTCRTGCW